MSGGQSANVSDVSFISAVEPILTMGDLSLRLAQFDQQIRSDGAHTNSSS